MGSSSSGFWEKTHTQITYRGNKRRYLEQQFLVSESRGTNKSFHYNYNFLRSQEHGKGCGTVSNIQEQSSSVEEAVPGAIKLSIIYS